MSQKLFILNFHGIGSPRRTFWPMEESYWVERRFFEAVLDHIKGRTDTLVTFDDCNASDVEAALPALQARGLKAHFYIVSDLLGKNGFLSVNDVRELHAAGMTIGNHGKLHRSWRGLAEWQLREELVEARDRLENIISDKVSFAACPNGSYDRRVLKHLRKCSYQRVYTSDEGPTRCGSWLQARNSLLRTHDLDAVHRILRGTQLSWKGLLRICKRTIKRCR